MRKWSGGIRWIGRKSSRCAFSIMLIRGLIRRYHSRTDGRGSDEGRGEAARIPQCPPRRIQDGSAGRSFIPCSRIDAKYRASHFVIALRLCSSQIRAVLMNASQLVSYDFFKDSLLSSGMLGNGMPLHILSSALSGTVATTICAPADVVKSRVMNASGNEGPVKLLVESFKREGPRFLFKGWLPAWSKSFWFDVARCWILTYSPTHTEHNLYVCIPGTVEEGSRHVPIAQGARSHDQGVRTIPHNGHHFGTPLSPSRQIATPATLEYSAQTIEYRRLQMYHEST